MPKPLDPARTHLLDALKSDLIGPYDPPHEVLSLPPIRWYLTGFLVPAHAAAAEAAAPGDEDDEIEAGDEHSHDAEAPSEPSTKQRPMLPSSLGISVLLPAPPVGQPDIVTIDVAWGEYVHRTTIDEITQLCRASWNAGG